jgi:hypothetical protein
MNGLTIDSRAVGALLAEATNAASQRAAYRVRDRAKQNLTSAGRVNTGKLRDSIKATRTVQTPTVSTWSVGSDLFYAGWQEFGRGPVRPIRAKVLRFKPKGSSVFIFRGYAGPATGAFFLRDAYRATTVQDFLR